MNTSIVRFFKILIAMISSLILLGYFVVATPQVQAQSNDPCTIENAKFHALDAQPSWNDKYGKFYLSYEPGGDGGWFQENDTMVVVQVETAGCAGQEIEIEVKSSRPDFEGDTIPVLEGRKFIVEEGVTEGYELLLGVGEEYCQELTIPELKIPSSQYLNYFGYTEGEFETDTSNEATEFIESIISLPDARGTEAELMLYFKTDFLRYIYSHRTYTGASEGIDLMSALNYRYGNNYNSETAPILRFLFSSAIAQVEQSFPGNISYPTPCNFYIEATSVETGEVYSTKAADLGGMPNHLRYSCDGIGSPFSPIGQNMCEQDNKWKLLQQNSNIGGSVRIDESNPCYDENGDGLRKEDCQELLAPIPGFGDRVDENLNIGTYINTILQMVIGFMGIIAVLMIIASGVKYMTTESFGGKADAKSTITNAFLGLLIAVSIFIILNTINPDLLNLNPGIGGVEIGQQDPDVPAGYTVDYNANTGIVNKYELPSDLKATLGLYCPGSGGPSEINQIATSFNNKTTYRFGGKGGHIPSNWSWQGSSQNPNAMCEDDRMCRTFCPSGTICLDCSGYVSHVLQCAGMTGGNLSGTSAIFSNGDWESIKNNTTDLSNNTINGRELTPGDLIGGRKWHVVIYIGNGQVAESSSDASGRLKNQGVKISDLESRVSSNNKFKYVRFMSS